jgi:hypothetical protein
MQLARERLRIKPLRQVQPAIPLRQPRCGIELIVSPRLAIADTAAEHFRTLQSRRAGGC